MMDSMQGGVKEPSHSSALRSAAAFVILAWNHWNLTADCLQSLRRVRYPDFDVILVDNGSTDGTAELARQSFPEVTVLVSECNLGFAAGANIGLRYVLARSLYKYVFLLNNDTVVPPDLLDVLVAAAEADETLGMLTPMVSYADAPERLWSIGSRRRSLTLAATEFGPGRVDPQLAEEPRDVDYVIGCAVLIRTSALRRVGLFDEQYFMYYEDQDLCIRFQQAGYRLRYLPRPVVLHRVSASTSDALPLRYYYLARSSVLFFATHGRGRYWLLVPYRLGSTVRTIGRLLCRRQWKSALAHMQGLRDGLRDL